MKKFFKSYLWLWEMIGAALLVAVGFIVKFAPGVMYALVGAIIFALGALRIVTLVKTTDDKVLKWFYAAELIIDMVIGGLLLFFGIKAEEHQWINDGFGYFIGGVLYLRGFVYFFATSVRGEEQKKIMFIIHIIILTGGAMIIARGGFSANVLGWVLLGLAVLSGLVVAGKGIKDYKNYRGNEQSERVTRKLKKEKKDQKSLDAPTDEQINNEISENTNIDNEEEQPSIQA